MKKLLFLIPLIILGLNGACLKTSDKDKALADDSNQCLNAFNIDSASSISTKIDGKEFWLKIERKCLNIHNIKIVLVSNDKNISEVKSYTPLLPFKIDKSYKNVKVKFEYDKDKIEFISNEVECPTILTGFKEVEEITDNLDEGLYYVLIKYPPFRKCYNVTLKKDTEHYIEYSTDNFAIRPDKFSIQLPKNVNEGVLKKYKAFALDYNDNISDYNSSNVEYKISFNSNIKSSQSFDLIDGKGTLSIYFANSGDDNVMTLIESKNEFASIDADDTIDECRYISYKSDSFNVNPGYRGWSGVGTNEKENDPSKTTIQTDIRQNVIKNLKYQKINY